MQTTIKKSLNNAVNQLPRASFDYIAATPIEKMTEPDAITRQEREAATSKFRLPRFANVVVCCTLLLVVGCGLFWQNLAVSSLITIDVNPSFEITANRRDKILEVRALNHDAIEVLADLQATNDLKSLRGLQVETAIESLFSSLGSSQYMNPQKNGVLLSVRNNNLEHSKRLERRLSYTIEKALHKTEIKPHIVYQTLGKTGKFQQESKKYQVSYGKLQLAHKLQERFPIYTVEKLVALPLDQLLALLDKAGFEDLDYLEETDDLGETYNLDKLFGVKGDANLPNLDDDDDDIQQDKKAVLQDLDDDDDDDSPSQPVSTTSKDKVSKDKDKYKGESAKDKAETAAEIAKEKAEAEAEIAKDKAEAEAELAKDKAEAEAELAKEKAEAEADSAKDRAEAEADSVKDKAEAEADSAKDKAEAEADSAEDKAEAEADSAEDKADSSDESES